MTTDQIEMKEKKNNAITSFCMNKNLLFYVIKEEKKTKNEMRYSCRYQWHGKKDVCVVSIDQIRDWMERSTNETSNGIYLFCFFPIEKLIS